MVTQLVIELVSQLINQPEDRIYFLIKKNYNKSSVFTTGVWLPL